MPDTARLPQSGRIAPAIAEVDLLTFASLIRQTRLTLRFVAPLAFEPGPCLAGRIRGAWGNSLVAMASSNMMAEEALGYLYAVDGSDQKPFALSAQEVGQELHVSLILFGSADRFREVALEALVSGLGGAPGLALSPRQPNRRAALRLIDAHWTRAEGIDLPRVVGSTRITVVTPLKLGPRDTIGLRYSDIWISAAQRCAAIARWSGLSIALDLGELRAAGNALKYDDRELRPVTWNRWSSRRPRACRLMSGMVGKLTVDQWNEDLTPLLHLGAITHVGANVSFGLGKFRVE